jgi:hypothetical protein
LSEEKDKKPKKLKEYKREFLPSVEFKTNPDYPIKYSECVVAGHRVTPREADIFYTYHTTHDIDYVCKKFGMTYQNLWDLRKRKWFEIWQLDWLKDQMDRARNKWFSNADALVQAQKNYLESPDDFPNGYGQAIAKMIDTLLRASPEGLRPTLVSKFEMEYQADIKNTIDININITPEKIKNLTPEQIDEWNRTGIMPQGLSEIVSDAVDIDYEDIGEEDDREEDYPEEIETPEEGA